MRGSAYVGIVWFHDHLVYFESPKLVVIGQLADNWLTAIRCYRVDFGETLDVQFSKLVGVELEIGPRRSYLDSITLFSLHFDVDGLLGGPVGDWFLVEVLFHLES